MKYFHKVEKHTSFKRNQYFNQKGKINCIITKMSILFV